MMTIDELVEQELTRVKPQLSAHEWFTLRDVLRASLRRVAVEAKSPLVYADDFVGVTGPDPRD